MDITHSSIKNFLETDNIDVSKFLANHEIMKAETKEIYQAELRRNSGNDISENASKTVHWMALIYNQPLGYPSWFMTAYPDVVKWLSELEEEKIVSIVGNLTENDQDETEHLKLPVLRKIVNAYKIIYKLECS